MDSPNPAPRLGFRQWPGAIYAIGDVHGCLERLREMEAVIASDGLDIEGEKWLVTVGDHIDRGPSSRGVIEHVTGPGPASFRRFALRGNHEQMMLDFLADPVAHSYWLDEGGAETLESYGIGASWPELGSDAFRTELVERIGQTHLDFIAALPMYLSLPGWLFVHAGIRPGVPLGLQADQDLLWIREPFLTSQLTGGLRVVHGHTPGRDIVMTPHRIGLDTHCFHSGRLSAVRVTPDGRTKTFSVSGWPS